MSGYTVASGVLFRQVLEGMSFAYLCSVKTLPFLDTFMKYPNYSTEKSVEQLCKRAIAAHVRRDALNTFTKAYDFYHRYAHPTKLTMSAGANFSMGGVPNIGPFFDPDKIEEYRKEVRGRIGFTKTLPGTITGLARNLSEW